MRPLKIIMNAFGPYKNEEIIDFKKLKGRSFFLIHGPTGAGKTTILDAICYALYGTTSGDLRSGEAMRSQYADFDNPTKVTFDFAVGAKKYRIIRIPRQEVLKARGQGTKIEVASAELYELDAEENVINLVAQKDVTDAIENILGFKSEQFRQVVLLPQGDFRKLLIAKSDERQKIMQILFKTQIYRDIELKLKEKYSALLEIQKTLDENEKTLLKSAGVLSKEELETKESQSKQRRKELIKAEKNSKAEFLKAQNDYQNASKIVELFLSQEKAQEEFKNIQGQLDEINKEKEKLKAIIAAQSIQDIEKQYLFEQKEYQNLSEDLKKIRADMLKTQNEYEDMQPLLVREEENITKIKELQEKKVYLTSLIPKSIKREDFKEKVSFLEGEVEKKKKGVQEFEAKVNLCQQSYIEKNTRYEEYSEDALKLPHLQIQLEQTKQVLAKLQDIEEKESNLKNLSKLLEKLIIQETEAIQTYNQLKLEYEELLEVKWQGQIAFLTTKLKVGEPCPVCNSICTEVKINKASNIPTDDVINRIKARVDKLELEKNKILGERSSVEGNYNILNDTLAEEKKMLDSILVTDRDELNKIYTKQLEKYRLYKTANDKLPIIKKELEEFIILKEETVSKLTNLNQELSLQQNKLTVEKSLLLECEQSIPDEYQNKVALEETINKVKAKIFVIEENYKRIVKRRDEKKEYLTQITTTALNKENEVEKVKSRLAEIEEEFLTRRLGAGFISDESYYKTKSLIGTIDTLTQKIQTYDTKYNLALEMANKTTEAISGLIKPDINVYLEGLEKFREKNNIIAQEIGALANELEKNKQWLDVLEEIVIKRHEVENKFGIVTYLYELANGKRTGITLERFVLARLLEEVTAAANLRLKTMSKGRYNLHRKPERSDKRTTSGLDLEVMDNHTGYFRDANTLSGGESFLASLALALGLADVVQAYSGGIHLDTIFVDEGFGTLDPEMLDFAIKALVDLQQGGRLVGIISHVPELKERIDARLEIKMTNEGSTSKFIVG